MASIRLSDCSEKVQAQLRAKLGLENPEPLITYHFAFKAGGKFTHLKSTDKEAFAKQIDEWRKAHPLIQYVIFATTNQPTKEN